MPPKRAGRKRKDQISNEEINENQETNNTVINDENAEPTQQTEQQAGKRQKLDADWKIKFNTELA